MTLILTVNSDNYVTQVSDRLVTRDGKVVSPKRNKAIVVSCNNARFVIGYTGAARIAGAFTDKWLLDYLHNSRAGKKDLLPIVTSLVNQATSLFASNSLSHPGLSFVVAGFLVERSFALLISNFEHWGSANSIPSKSFHVQYSLSERQPDSCAFHANGYDTALTTEIRTAIEHQFAEKFFLRSDSKTAEMRVVEIIREAANTSNGSKFIGKDCMAVSISSSANLDIACTYYPNTSAPEMFTPCLIGPMVSIGTATFLGNFPNKTVRICRSKIGKDVGNAK